MPRLDLPPFPELTSLNQELPQQTDPVEIGTSSDRLFLFANSDDSGASAWVPDVPGIPGRRPLAPILLAYWDGKPPIDYTLRLRQFWRQVPSTYTHVPQGGGFQKTYTTLHGVSTTDTQTLSAELGVEAGGLSAKLSATFSHSVTVTDQETEQTTFTVGSPEPGFVRVWVMWQLIDEVVALDPAGNVIPRGEAQLGRKGEVEWDSVFSRDSLVKPHSGAFLSYPNPQQEFPTTIFVPQQKDFPI